MFFSKSFDFSIVLAALYLSSNSVSARTGEGLLSEKQAGVGRGGRESKTGKNVRTSFSVKTHIKEPRFFLSSQDRLLCN